MKRFIEDLLLIVILVVNGLLWVAMVIFLMPIMCWWALTQDWPPHDGE